MMRLARKAPLLVALSLLASAATVHAECAWVLWSGTTNPLRAHETKEGCEVDRRVHLFMATLGAEKEQIPAKEANLECLPDTPITETPSECNWMLWTYVPMPRPDKTVSATKQECEMARDDANRTMAKAGDSAFICGESDTSTPQQQHVSVWLLMRTGMMHSLIGTFKTHQQCQQRLSATRKERGLALCLPNTVDPLGPKGK
jgi:hypothetical protein